MKNETMLMLLIFVPVAGAFLLPLAAKISTRARNALALIFISTSLVFAALLLPAVLAARVITVNIALPLGFNFLFCADALAVFMAIVSSLVSAIIVLYSFGYISHYENQNEYYAMVVLFLGAMMGLVFSANLIFLYLFWEITAIASWRLIGFFRGKSDVFKADKSFLVTVFGSLLMLAGFILLYQEAGSFDLAAIRSVLKTRPLSDLAVLFILTGIFSKSATLPFHTWLPDAGVAPSPVTALLHAAVLVKIGVYVFARLFIVNFGLNAFWQTVVPVIACASALVAASAAFIETDLKRLIAYSTISQIGFIFLGFSLNTEMGIAGALLFILMHGLAKAGLFLCAGIVEQNTRTRDITKLGGLISVMPLTALSFMACAFSVMGVPPFGGFFSKYMVIAAAFSAGKPVIAAMFLLAALLTILYLLRAFNMVFLGEPKTAGVKEGSGVMVSSVVILMALSLAAGVFIRYPAYFAVVATQQMLGVIK